MRSAFVIPCKFKPENPVIFRAVSSIKKFQPKSEVYVLDSNSEDTSYLDVCRNLGAVIPDYKNLNYATGATWWAFKETKHEFIYTFHDSCSLLENVEDLEDKQVSTMRYFRSWHGVGWSPTRSESGNNGHIDQDQFDWADSCMKLTSIQPRHGEVFNAVFGPMLFAKREFLQRLHDIGLSQILPNSKDQEQTMERVMGIYLSRLGVDAKEVSLQGYCYDYGFRPEYRMKKEFLGRT